MVERAARAVCSFQGLDPDALAASLDAPAETWRTFILLVETVLDATLLAAIPVLAGTGRKATLR